MQKITFIILILGLLLTGAPATAVNKETLPPVDESATPLSSKEKVFVKKFRLEGNTVFSNEELAVITAPYENREISAEELQTVSKNLTLYYYSNGYVNSGAVIPDQEVKDGVITLKIIEGKLFKTEISGNTWLRDGYVRSRLDLATDDGQAPLNVNKIQERLQLLKQDPLIRNINAEIKPGLERGEAIMDVQVDEARPYNVGLTFNNYESPSIGAYRGEITLTHNNLTGWGDALRLQYGLTEGLDDYFGSYTIPLTRWGTTLTLEAEHSPSTVVAYPFEELDIESETTTYTAELRHPFYKTLSKELAMSLRMEKRKSETSLLGEGFAFSEGVEPDGTSRVSVLRFSQEWVDRSLAQVIAVRSTFNFGLDIWDATINDTGPDGRFFFWLGQFQWLRQVGFLDSQILLRTDLRFSADPLLPMEKFEIGGVNTVRGYRENQMTTDNGIVASLEWRIPIGHVKIPGMGKGASDGLIQFCPFYDYGKGWNTDMTDPSPDNISSVGTGLRWSLSEKIFAQIYWGYALRDIEPASEYDLQDDGIHFQLNALLF